MPLAPKTNRKPLHSRKITCESYLRDDGLVEIDAQLIDKKPFDFPNKDCGGILKVGKAYHGMSIRIALDKNFIIREVEALMDDTPYTYCKSVTSVFSQLIDVQIGVGWNRQVKRIMGGRKGCTHLTELLTPIVTTAFQSMVSINGLNGDENMEHPHEEYVPQLINTCFSHADDSPVIKENWPEHFKENT